MRFGFCNSRIELQKMTEVFSSIMSFILEHVVLFCDKFQQVVAFRSEITRVITFGSTPNYLAI